MYEKEIILHDECNCLISNGIFDDKCIKRYFRVLDLNDFKHKYIGFCNEYLRLRIRKAQVEFEKKYYYDSHVRIAKDVIENELKNYCVNKNYEEHCLFTNNVKDLLTSKIHFVICENPFVYQVFSLQDAINLYLDFPYVSSIEKKIYETINNYLQNIQYIKYKTKYKKLIAMNNKISKFILQDERETFMLELFTEILKFKINNK